MFTAIPVSAAILPEDSPFILPVVWLAVTLFIIIVEALTADLVSVWFAPGALAAMIVSFFVDEFWIQAVVFVALSAVLLILSRTVLRGWLEKRHKTLKTGADALAGTQALVAEDIDNAAETGAVKVNGQLWTARMEPDTDTAKVGEHVEILRVAGSKVFVRRLP